VGELTCLIWQGPIIVIILSPSQVSFQVSTKYLDNVHINYRNILIFITDY
jgi:hypothetical protein